MRLKIREEEEDEGLARTRRSYSTRDCLSTVSIYSSTQSTLLRQSSPSPRSPSPPHSSHHFSTQPVNNDQRDQRRVRWRCTKQCNTQWQARGVQVRYTPFLSDGA